MRHRAEKHSGVASDINTRHSDGSRAACDSRDTGEDIGNTLSRSDGSWKPSKPSGIETISHFEFIPLSYGLVRGRRRGARDADRTTTRRLLAARRAMG